MSKIIKIKHVIFDWAGTIFDDHYQSYLATKELFRIMGGSDITFAQYRKDFSVPVMPFYKKYGIQRSLGDINESFFDIYRSYQQQGRVFDGVREVLKYLKEKKLRIAIFSTIRQSDLERLGASTGLDRYIDVYNGGVCNKVKELGVFLKKHRMDPTSALYVGDMDHDMEAARKNHLWCGCVLNGYQDLERLLQQRPTFVWKDQADWLGFFRAILEPRKVRRHHKIPITTVGAMIMHREKMLCVLSPKWGFRYGIVGGKVRYGESLCDALQREVKEETGLTIKIKKLVLVQDCIRSHEFIDDTAHFLLFNYLAVTGQTKVKLNHEATSYLWVSPREALKLNLNTPTKILVEKYLSSTP